MKKVGDQVGLPESTVDNLLVLHPEVRAARRKLKKAKFSEKLNLLREQALSVIRQHSDMSRKELTDSFPEIFIWLKNHDKEWLYKQLPKPMIATQVLSMRYSKQHLLWKKKQQQAIKGLRGFAIRMIATPPTNQRLSIAYILKSLGIRNPPSHTRQKMPLFWRQVSRLAETHEDFQFRKLNTLFRSKPDLFRIYSARRVLKIARAYPPVTENVLARAELALKGIIIESRPSISSWLLIRHAEEALPIHRVRNSRRLPKSFQEQVLHTRRFNLVYDFVQNTFYERITSNDTNFQNIDPMQSSWQSNLK